MARPPQKHMTGTERVMADHEIIVTKTDTTGKIKYGNTTFFKYAGYAKSDLLGQQHNKVRHPDMPRAVFKMLWDEIQAGREIFAYVNNAAANGEHYWVFAHVTPSFDANNTIVGFHSNRRAPNRETLNTHIIPMYDALLDIEKQHDSPKAGLTASADKIKTILQGKKMTFNQYMFSLGV